MAAVDVVRMFLGPSEPRSPREIGRDIDDEIAFHLDQLERELLETGTPPEQARGAALLRFGDPQRIRRACERIAMENNLMLQKINLVLMVVVVVAVAAVSVQMFTTQRYNTLALQAITADLAEMKAARGVESPRTEPPVRKPDLRSGLTPGTWRQVGAGDAFLKLLGERDVNNFAGRPSGVLEIPAAGLSLRLSFRTTTGKNLGISSIPMVNGGIGPREGRWVLEDDILSINLGDIMPPGREVLRLELADASG